MSETVSMADCEVCVNGWYMHEGVQCKCYSCDAWAAAESPESRGERQQCYARARGGNGTPMRCTLPHGHQNEGSPDYSAAHYFAPANPVSLPPQRSDETPTPSLVVTGSSVGAGAEEAPFKSCDCDRLRERLAEMRAIEKRIAAALNLIRDPYPFAPYWLPAEPKPIRCDTVADAVEAYMRLAESEVTTLRAQLAEARKALGPFARAEEYVARGGAQHFKPPWTPIHELTTSLTRAHLIAALAAAHPTEENR